MLSNFFMNALGRESLIAPDDHWALLVVMCLAVAVSIYLEQKYAWASKVSGAVIALIFALLLSNLSIVPVSCTLYDDIIWGFAVPMAIPLLLLQCNMKKIWRETGRMMVIFLIGAVGTCVGVFIAYFLLRGAVPGLEGAAVLETGGYIGGGVNFAALAAQYEVPGEMIGAVTVSDNLLMTLYFFVLLWCAGSRFFRSHFTHPNIDAVEAAGTDDSKTQAAQYWSRKDISLKDIAINVALAVTIVFLSRTVSGILGGLIPTGNILTQILNAFFGSQYVWITTFSMLVSTFGDKQIAKLNGSQEIATFLIYLFFFVIGVPASIFAIITKAPLLLVFSGIIVIINMLFCFVGAKLFKFDLEDAIIASNANIGGPTTAAGMAIAQGWTDLVGPAMLTGTFGYVIGTYLGIIVGTLLGM